VSFILDALRKSEHERQKSTGPGLAEIPIAAPRPKTNVWATAAVTLLVVNLTAVGVLLLRRADAPPEPNATAPAAPPTTTATPATPAATTPPAAAAGNPTLAQPTPAPVTAPVAPVALAQRPVETGRNPLAEELGDAGQGLDPGMADAAASVPAGPPAVARQELPRRGGSVVYAPVPQASDSPYSPPPAEPEPAAGPAPAAAPSGAGLPGADDMVARGMPELHLDLHVYSTVPKQRFIFVNSRKYGEGATLQEGPVVEAITPDGAVLNFRGSRFKLSH
jgi:general secretion pathway protein B